MSVLALLTSAALAAEGGRYLLQTSALPLDEGELVAELTVVQPSLVGVRYGVSDWLELWGGGGIVLDWGGFDPALGVGARGAWSLHEGLHAAFGVGVFHPSVRQIASVEPSGGARAALTVGRADRHHATASCALVATSTSVGVVPGLAGTLAAGDRWDLGLESEVEIWKDLGDITASPVARRTFRNPAWSLTLGWPWAISQFHAAVEGGGSFTGWEVEPWAPTLRLEALL